jgi:Tfp pilus assembly ATPase PilU
MRLLPDHDVEGPSHLIFATLVKMGWAGLLSLEFTTFSEQELPVNSSDGAVWRYCQSQGLILITANRSMVDSDSLEAVIRRENNPSSLPVITISNPQRVSRDTHYRRRCALTLAEILFDWDSYRGCRRLFIP